MKMKMFYNLITNHKSTYAIIFNNTSLYNYVFFCNDNIIIDICIYIYICVCVVRIEIYQILIPLFVGELHAPKSLSTACFRPT